MPSVNWISPDPCRCVPGDEISAASGYSGRPHPGLRAPLPERVSRQWLDFSRRSATGMLFTIP